MPLIQLKIQFISNRVLVHYGYAQPEASFPSQRRSRVNVKKGITIDLLIHP